MLSVFSLFCVVMRINADKPRGNSDYYFQHITTRERSRRRETGGKTRKAKHKERHTNGAHNRLHSGVPENMSYPKVSSGRLRCFSDATATKFTKFCKLSCRFQILTGVILQNITLTSTDGEKFHQNEIMMLAAIAFVKKVDKVTI